MMTEQTRLPSELTLDEAAAQFHRTWMVEHGWEFLGEPNYRFEELPEWTKELWRDLVRDEFVEQSGNVTNSERGQS